MKMIQFVLQMIKIMYQIVNLNLITKNKINSLKIFKFKNKTKIISKLINNTINKIFKK